MLFMARNIGLNVSIPCCTKGRIMIYETIQFNYVTSLIVSKLIRVVRRVEYRIAGNIGGH